MLGIFLILRREDSTSGFVGQKRQKPLVFSHICNRAALQRSQTAIYVRNGVSRNSVNIVPKSNVGRNCISACAPGSRILCLCTILGAHFFHGCERAMRFIYRCKSLSSLKKSSRQIIGNNKCESFA